MRILFSLALLLTIGSISAQSMIQGTWSRPYIYSDFNSYCCIPTSIKIYCSSTSTCTASYQFPNTVGSKCWRMFMSSNTQLSLSSNSYTYSNSYTSQTTFFGNMKFNFEADNSTGIPKLEVTAAYTSISDKCEFEMQTRNGAVSNSDSNYYNGGSNNYNNGSNGSGGFFIVIIIFFIVVASASAKQYQRRQANVIIAQNLCQQPITTVPGFNFNTPPTVVQVPQPQIVQHQVTYTAPNQFPNTQVNMNYGGGNNVQFPNAQVNMNYGGNNGGFNVQGHY